MNYFVAVQVLLFSSNFINGLFHREITVGKIILSNTKLMKTKKTFLNIRTIGKFKVAIPNFVNNV